MKAIETRRLDTNWTAVQWLFQPEHGLRDHDVFSIGAEGSVGTTKTPG